MGGPGYVRGPWAWADHSHVKRFSPVRNSYPYRLRRMFLRCVVLIEISPLLLLVEGWVVPSVARSAMITVDRTDDEPSAIGCDETTPNDCSLRGALITA